MLERRREVCVRKRSVRLVDWERRDLRFAMSASCLEAMANQMQRLDDAAEQLRDECEVRQAGQAMSVLNNKSKWWNDLLH